MSFSIFAREVLNENGPIYAPYAFDGDWTDEEMAVIGEAIAPYVPEKVHATFNNWTFYKGDDSQFLGWKATWEMGFLKGSTPEELADAIVHYYSR